MNHRNTLITRSVLAVFAILATSSQAFFLTTAHAAKHPNIVFVYADDLGWGDVQPNNPTSKIPTPAFNRLAKEGMNFTDGHSGSAVCTPSRYTFLTGRYCWRSSKKSGVLNGYSSPLIEKERPTIASFLRDHGYTTGIVGKWHLGLVFAKSGSGEKENDYTQPLTDTPADHGFDYSYVIPASLDFPPYVYIDGHRVTNPECVQQSKQSFPAYLRKGPRSKDLVMEDCLDHLTDRACDFLTKSSKDKQKPFFLYFPLTAPHKPVLPHKRFRGKSGVGPHGDFILQVDATLGRVLDTLDKLQLTDDTLFIFSSDNGSFMHKLSKTVEGKNSTQRSAPADHVTDNTIQGYFPENHRANAHLRGTKADAWEAGHRVPFFVRWPGKVKPGSVCKTPVGQVDIFATAAKVIDAKIPQGAAPDSYSFLKLLQGKPEKYQREHLICHSANGTFAIRDGKWKLILSDGSGGRGTPKGKPFARPYQLFDLEKDPSETTNLIEQNPEVAQKLEKECLRIRDNEGR